MSFFQAWVNALMANIFDDFVWIIIIASLIATAILFDSIKHLIYYKRLRKKGEGDEDGE